MKSSALVIAEMFADQHKHEFCWKLDKYDAERCYCWHWKKTPFSDWLVIQTVESKVREALKALAKDDGLAAGPELLTESGITQILELAKPLMSGE